MSRYLEVVALRAAPGLVNLATMLLLGGWLSVVEYGVYSTALATATFVGTVVFGPLTSAVISQHANLDAQGLGADYESSLVSAVLILALIVFVLGAIGWQLGFLEWAWLTPVVAFGLYTAVQEILHARLRVWAFGTTALCQALTFLALAWFWVRREPSPNVALLAFAASYAAGALMSLAFSGFPPLRRPNIRLLSATARIGGAYALSSIVEYGLYLGMRYLIQAFSTAHHLGVFSFCVDIAQRFIGFLINAASFIIVPAAFKADAQRGGGAFREVLLTGVLQAIGLSMTAFVLVLLLREMGLVAALRTDSFEPVVFAIVSAAVVFNRLKKLLLDPFAMRARRGAVIALGYALSAPIALVAAAYSLVRYGGYSAEIAYLMGYVLAGAISFFALRRVVARTTVLGEARS